MRCATAITTLFVTATAYAAPTQLGGIVETSEARDFGDLIVTESTILRPDGTRARMIQLGGVVNGIGMLVSHQPPLLAVGDHVELVTVAHSTTDGESIHMIADVGGPPVTGGGQAQYGVVRTTRSRRPVWRDSGCIDVAYGPSISTLQAATIDAAFHAWTDASSCTALAFSRWPGTDVITADGISSVHIHRSKWCRPATSTEPELCYLPAASGITRLRFVDDPAVVDDGRILEADIELNAVDYTLVTSGDSSGRGPALDLQSLATHEVGHLLGLAHSCGTGTEPWPTDHEGQNVPACEGLSPDAPAVRSTMYYELGPGELGQRTVEADDVAALCSVARELACGGADVTGSCATSPGPGWLVVTIVLVCCPGSRRRARRRLLCRAPRVTSGRAGHFARDIFSRPVADLNDVVLPVCTPTPRIGGGLDQTGVQISAPSITTSKRAL